MQLLEDSKRFECVRDRGVVRPALIENRGHAPDIGVGGQLWHPGFQREFKVVAVYAAVPEKLRYLDLPGILDRQGALQRGIARRRVLLGTQGDGERKGGSA